MQPSGSDFSNVGWKFPTRTLLDSQKNQYYELV